MVSRSLVEYAVLVALSGLALPAVLKLASRNRITGQRKVGLSLLLAFLSQIPIFNLVVLYVIAFFMDQEGPKGTLGAGLH